MKKLALALIAAAVFVAPALEAATKPQGEEKLAKMLEGREAGKPVKCIPLYGTESNVIDKTAIVYKVGRTLYVNRPANPRELSDNDILFMRLNTDQLCSVDIVRTKDRGSFVDTGFISLGEFVPYTKVALRD